MATLPTDLPDAAIRLMRTRDLAAVVELEQDVYPQPWSLRVFEEELALSNRTYLVAENGRGELLGYAGFLLVEDDAHITTLAVGEAARGRRLGTRLMLALVAAAMGRGARHLTLEVRVSNTSAQALYRRFGFAPVGLRKNYYRNEDAMVMWATDIDSDDYRERMRELADRLEEGT
jgi:ribosomal-protein-alanine N-acetyltransferase